MKQSTLPFRKFRSSERYLRPLFLLVSISLGSASFLGCQNLWESKPETPAVPEPRRVYAANVKVMLEDSHKHQVYIGDFDRSSCKAGFPQLWSFTFASPLGSHNFDIDYSTLQLPKTDAIQVKSLQERYSIKFGELPAPLVARSICESSSESDSILFTMGTPDADAMLQALRYVAPDCTFDVDAEAGLRCKLQHPDAKELLSQLEALKKNMTTKWNHQPYLLIRRLTLATQMLEALRSAKSTAEIKKSCRILRFSLPNELPLSFRSKIWQEQVCEGKPNEELVLIGLDQAVKELQTLAHRIEDASLIGLFTLAVPRAQSPAKDYWISFQPIEMPLVMSDVPPQITSCVWHPLFFEQTEQLLIAYDLNQVAHSDRSVCSPAPSLARAKREADIYVRSSMASEMEFQISNGQSKQLRLPTGDYRYSVSQFNNPFPEEMVSTEEITPLSSGRISWKTARPHLIIKSW